MRLNPPKTPNSQSRMLCWKLENFLHLFGSLCRSLTSARDTRKTDHVTAGTDAKPETDNKRNKQAADRPNPKNRNANPQGNERRHSQQPTNDNETPNDEKTRNKEHKTGENQETKKKTSKACKRHCVVCFCFVGQKSTKNTAYKTVHGQAFLRRKRDICEKIRQEFDTSP